MKQIAKIKLCNRLFGCTLFLMLISGIQLEVTSGRNAWWVWVHIILGILLTALSLYHIFLHYRFGNWFARFAKNRNTVTRVLWWTFLLTVISGIAATIIWLIDHEHSHLGAIHGKIGFLMVVVAIAHIARHIRQRKKTLTTR